MCFNHHLKTSLHILYLVVSYQSNYTQNKYDDVSPTVPSCADPLICVYKHKHVRTHDLVRVLSVRIENHATMWLPNWIQPTCFIPPPCTHGRVWTHRIELKPVSYPRPKI